MADHGSPDLTTEASVLRALAHPLRRRLLDVLSAKGPASVSILARATDQRVANISFHLKVLSLAGLVEEAPENARDGRERWWRHSGPARWSSEDFQEAPADRAVAETLQRMSLERQVAAVSQWLDAESGKRSEWSKGSFSIERWLSLSPDELASLAGELEEVMQRWSERSASTDQVDGREPVLVFAHGLPSEP
ncbi:ArsR/SmtB family transcription factor [Aeromicrobium sp. CF4.19]|uniref:ArsR/SmtB family transcription factor n=1 Tax=Aeromicrobium sp. CF4.19 TaxID=3373082 RepID=UPI003EE6110F